MLRWIAAAALVAACGSDRQTGTAESHMSTFHLKPNSNAPSIAVTMAVPSTWTAAPDQPVFTLPGLDGGRITLAALELKGDESERIQTAIELQYGEGDAAKDAQRTELSGGRVWMERKELRMIHARVFVPYDRGVVMGVALIPHAAAQRLPEIRRVFETLAVGAP
ncbi:MAG TPA: hypothetical protein VL463_23490 [Kofleriaceae bacterium]|jgi:hypothetical protein|nr:hypothetical protein [Kofleriaceae bacterium]